MLITWKVKKMKNNKKKWIKPKVNEKRQITTGIACCGPSGYAAY